MDDLPFDFYKRTILLFSGHCCHDFVLDTFELQWLKVFPHLSHLSHHWDANYVTACIYVRRDIFAPVPRLLVASTFDVNSNNKWVTVQSYSEACKYSTNLKFLDFNVNMNPEEEKLNWRELDTNEMKSLAKLSKMFVNVDVTEFAGIIPEFYPKLSELGFVCNRELCFRSLEWSAERDEFIISQVRAGALRHLTIPGETLACRETTAIIFRNFFESSVFHQIQLYEDDLTLFSSQFRDLLGLWARCSVPKAIRKSLSLMSGAFIPNALTSGLKSRMVSFGLEYAVQRFVIDVYAEERPSRVARFSQSADSAFVCVEFIDLGD